jgi:hypothetical protein
MVVIVDVQLASLPLTVKVVGTLVKLSLLSVPFNGGSRILAKGIPH